MNEKERERRVALLERLHILRQQGYSPRIRDTKCSKNILEYEVCCTETQRDAEMEEQQRLKEKQLKRYVIWLAQLAAKNLGTTVEHSSSAIDPEFAPFLKLLAGFTTHLDNRLLADEWTRRENALYNLPLHSKHNETNGPYENEETDVTDAFVA